MVEMKSKKSGVDDIIPRLVWEPLLNKIENPALLLANLFQLGFEEWDLVLVCRFLEVFLHRFPIDL